MLADGPVQTTATLEVRETGKASPTRRSRRVLRDLGDEPWQLFPIDAIAESLGREFEFRLEAEPESESIRVVSGSDGEPDSCRPVYTPPLARLLDPWLSRGRGRLPTVPEFLERYLDRILSESVTQRGYGFLNLAHLADAFGRIPEPISSLLSVGAGTGYTEAFLAGRLPDASIDVREAAPPTVAFPMSNLRFALAPEEAAEQYDFVFSLTNLQRHADAGGALRRLAARVKPGKFLYVSAPLASADEQQDPQRRQAAREFGHFTPGFSFEDLEALFEANGLEILHASSMFHLDLVLPLRRILDGMSRAELECAVEPIARLLLWDLRYEKAPSAQVAEGLRVLGRMRDA
jgi:SAM-dependent methyltransferase